MPSSNPDHLQTHHTGVRLSLFTVGEEYNSVCSGNQHKPLYGQGTGQDFSPRHWPGILQGDLTGLS